MPGGRALNVAPILVAAGIAFTEVEMSARRIEALAARDARPAIRGRSASHGTRE